MFTWIVIYIPTKFCMFFSFVSRRRQRHPALTTAHLRHSLFLWYYYVFDIPCLYGSTTTHGFVLRMRTPSSTTQRISSRVGEASFYFTTAPLAFLIFMVLLHLRRSLPFRLYYCTWFCSSCDNTILSNCTWFFSSHTNTILTTWEYLLLSRGVISALTPDCIRNTLSLWYLCLQHSSPSWFYCKWLYSSHASTVRLRRRWPLCWGGIIML